MNEALFKPNKTLAIHACKNKEPQADAVNNFFKKVLLEMISLNHIGQF